MRHAARQGFVRRGHGLRVALAAASVLLSPVAGAVATCTVTATGPAFGLYNPLNTSATLANGSVTATCTWLSGGASNISMVSSFSPGNSGSYPNRFMLSGTNRLNYNLYFDSAFTQIRGNGTGGTQTGNASLRVSRGQPVDTVISVVYGRVPAGQNVSPGLYTDTVLMTITY